MRTRSPVFGRRGGTLTELMVSVAILSIGVLGLFGAFRYIGKSIFVSRSMSLATNLGQERIEALKNINYYGLLITTASATDATVSPAIVYDTVNYPPEAIKIGGINFTRYTYVNMAILAGTDITAVAANYPDTGLKQITVDVVWNDQGYKKRWTLRNLLENPNVNPLDATITGTISNAGGGVVAGAVVTVEQNENWSGSAGALGVYTFQVYHGTYTLRASSAGFVDSVSASQVVNRGQTTTVNLTLTAYATGYLSGIVWYNPDLVISQVVASCLTVVGDLSPQNVEYVELYNPTTFTIDIGQTGIYPKKVSLKYRDEDALFDIDDTAAGFGLVHVTSFVAPGRYYLFANATSFYITGSQIAADAYYDSLLTYPNRIRDDKGGAIVIYRQPATAVDLVGWDDNATPKAPVWEGAPIPDIGGGNDGLGTPAGKQIVRVSSPGVNGWILPNYGRAYDSDSNDKDFLYETAGVFTGLVYAPRSSGMGGFTTLAGKPAIGGYVSSSDPNSGSTQTYAAYITSGALSLPYARFQLAGVSTGTWSVAMNYGSYYSFYDNVVVAQNAYTGVPNAATTPAWPAVGAMHAQLSSVTISGFVKGIVTDTSGAALNGIVVQGGGGVKTTGANGTYFMAVTSGTVTIIANPNNTSPSYIESIASVLVTEGAVTTQDFPLGLGGRLSGYVTTGTTPLTGQAMVATSGSGSQSASGTTDATGIFTMRNISTGPYTVAPVLESGQDSSPNSIAVTLTSTGTISVGTFTVSGAFGSITGTVTDASGLVTSGALILASTNAIAATPVSVVGSSAPALTPTYMVSSKADGTYTLPVRGGNTYYLSVYVPVISAAGTVSITTKTYASIIVSPSAATTRNVTIP